MPNSMHRRLEGYRLYSQALSPNAFSSFSCWHETATFSNSIGGKRCLVIDTRKLLFNGMVSVTIRNYSRMFSVVNGNLPYYLAW